MYIVLFVVDSMVGHLMCPKRNGQGGSLRFRQYARWSYGVVLIEAMHGNMH
jgi:hypothetical protein